METDVYFEFVHLGFCDSTFCLGLSFPCFYLFYTFLLSEIDKQETKSKSQENSVASANISHLFPLLFHVMSSGYVMLPSNLSKERHSILIVEISERLIFLNANKILRLDFLYP